MRPGEIVADRFEIERLAGSGGMGAVYRARDRTTGEHVALKMLYGHFVDLPEHAERFSREARVLSELRHPGIVRYIGHGASISDPWLAIEWLEGESVGARLKRAGLTIAETLTLGIGMAEALAAAHERGIVHRDLKPSNLYLVDRSVSRLKVLDFGVARLAGRSTLTESGVVIGTPFYMSPEQARADREIDARADVFAMGCVLFHALVGRAPFASTEIHASLLKVVLEEAPRLGELRDDVPRALDDLVARMLSKAPEDRPANGARVADELARIEAPSESRAAPPSARSIALTAREQKVSCALLLKFEPEASDAPPSRRGMAAGGPTLKMVTRTEHAKALVEAVARYQASIEHLPSGALLISVPTGGSPTDHAARAARCGLGLRERMPGVPLALVAGRGVGVVNAALGAAVERGEALLARGTAEQRIRLDEVSAGLLDARFDVAGDDLGLYLRGERDLFEGARPLLGRATPCVGRDHELGLLDAVLSECERAPSARAVLVTAPAGVGKSRLRHELLRHVRSRSPAASVWIAQGDPMRAGSPFGMLAQMVRREAGLREGDGADVNEQKLRARLARHLRGKDLRRIGEFLGELVGVRVAGEPSLALKSAREDPMLMGDQIRAAWEDFLVAESEAQALLLVLEDLHWGDLPTVKILDATLRNLADRPLMVLAFARPEVHGLFPRLWESRGVQEIHLRELSVKASEKLVREVLGPDAGAGVTAKLVERAAGNAFYLEELIRAASSGKTDAMPETVLAMVQARLEAVPSEGRRVLRAASVFGKAFWPGGVAAMFAGDRLAEAVPGWLGELVEQEILTRRGEGKFPGEHELAFRHALIREAAYAMLTDADRKLAHRVAGGWLEAAGEGDAALLAEHFDRGGEPVRAVAWYRRGAEQALEGNDFAATVARARRGAEHATGAVRAALRMLELEANKWIGDAALAERAGVLAMQDAPKGSPLWLAAAGETASMRVRLGKFDELAELAQSLLDLDLGAILEDGASCSRVVTALARAAASLLHAGHYAPAETLAGAIDRAAEKLSEDDHAAMARLFALRASRALCNGDPAGSLHFTEQSIRRFLYTGDVRNACLVRVNAASALLELGAHPRAERMLRDALAEAERMGLTNVVALSKQQLAPALARGGQLEEADAMASDAASTFATLSNRRQEGRSRIYLAGVCLAKGDVERADRESSAALAALEHIPPLRALALATRARVLLARGDVAEARALAEKALAGALDLAGLEEGEAAIRLVRAEALAACGAADESKVAFGEARERLIARADAIADPVLRRLFLEHVPENARTIDSGR